MGFKVISIFPELETDSVTSLRSVWIYFCWSKSRRSLVLPEKGFTPDIYKEAPIPIRVAHICLM